MTRIEKSKVFVIFAVSCLTTIMMIGCQSSWTDRIGSHMDRIAKGYEKFGTISMSSPVLVEAKKDAENGYFDFDLEEKDPCDYYNDARKDVQGLSAMSEQFVRTSRLGLKVQANITETMAHIANLMEYRQKLMAYQTQKALQAQAAELEAQNVLDKLSPDASEEEIKKAKEEAARIRAGEPIEMPSYPKTETGLPSIDDGVAPDAVGDGDGLIQALGLLGDSTALKIPNRSAINTAAGDTVTEGIFRLLGNPTKAMDFEDKLMMFGVSMVTVSPGWLTRKNYTAELSVSCGYDYDVARRKLLIALLKKEQSKNAPDKDDKLIDLINAVLNETRIEESEIIEEYEDEYGKTIYGTNDDYIPQRFKKEFRELFTPLSAAVSPMTDVDALDLASSQRRQASNALNIAAALSYAGLEAQSEFFKEWSKRSEQDVRTRTAYAAVTAFSNGGFFGFRVRPRLKALENPALFGSKSENVLEHQTFPIVTIVGIDRDDLKLGFDVEKDDYGKPVIDDKGTVKIVAFEPYISFRQTASWLPNKSMLNPGNRLSETERLRWASSCIEAYENLKSADAEIADEDISKFIENRILMLDYHTLGSWNNQFIPIELFTEK